MTQAQARKVVDIERELDRRVRQRHRIKVATWASIILAGALSLVGVVMLIDALYHRMSGVL